MDKKRVAKKHQNESDPIYPKKKCYNLMFSAEFPLLKFHFCDHH